MKNLTNTRNSSLTFLNFLTFAFVFFLTWNGCANSVEVADSNILQCPDKPVIYSGEATYYNFANGAGSCSFDSTPGDLMVGAINLFDYGGSRMCGACLRVNGPEGNVTIRVVDLCPECSPGDLDLSPQAFSLIADTTLGRVPVTWRIVPCETVSPITFQFNDSTNQWWTAVQLRNHRYPVFSLEYRNAVQKEFKQLNRTDYNYFIEPGGAGMGPLLFRVTDIYGHVVIDTVKNYLPGENIPGQLQFPPCDIK